MHVRVYRTRLINVYPTPYTLCIHPRIGNPAVRPEAIYIANNLHGQLREHKVSGGRVCVCVLTFIYNIYSYVCVCVYARGGDLFEILNSLMRRERNPRVDQNFYTHTVDRVGFNTTIHTHTYAYTCYHMTLYSYIIYIVMHFMKLYSNVIYVILDFLKESIAPKVI